MVYELIPMCALQQEEMTVASPSKKLEFNLDCKMIKLWWLRARSISQIRGFPQANYLPNLGFSRGDFREVLPNYSYIKRLRDVGCKTTSSQSCRGRSLGPLHLWKVLLYISDVLEDMVDGLIHWLALHLLGNPFKFCHVGVYFSRFIDPIDYQLCSDARTNHCNSKYQTD